MHQERIRPIGCIRRIRVEPLNLDARNDVAVASAQVKAKTQSTSCPPQ